ncbi:hypothetical protein MASR2M79_09570 [Aminivibrio sp.]
MVKAGERARALKDEYVSVEHLFGEFLEEGRSTGAGRILGDTGITEEKFPRPRRSGKGERPERSETPTKPLENTVRISSPCPDGEARSGNRPG